MTVKTPFFISPAYSVPRMTNSFRSKLSETLVVEVKPSLSASAGNWPLLNTTKSGSPKFSSCSGVGRINILCMNSAW